MNLYLFDLMDFDVNGDVIESKKFNIGSARANYLYLLSKYNQKLLEKGEGISDFFKSELSNLLENVKAGKDFENAKKCVLEHCKEEVCQIAYDAKSDKELIEKLNIVAVKKVDSEFSKDFGKAINNLQLVYIITNITDKICSELENFDKNELENDDKTKLLMKSKFFKKVINYNSLFQMASLVAEGKMTRKGVINENVVLTPDSKKEEKKVSATLLAQKMGMRSRVHAQ